MRSAPVEENSHFGGGCDIRISRIPITLLSGFSRFLLPLAAEQLSARPVADWIASGVIYEINPRTFSAAWQFSAASNQNSTTSKTSA
jgi:hypothetical protein